MVVSVTPPQLLLNDRDRSIKGTPITLPKRKKRVIGVSEDKISPRRLLFSDHFCQSFASDSENWELLGKGSFGRVIRGRIYNTNVAVKICPKGACDCIGEKNAMIVKHPNIIAFYRIMQIEANSINEVMIANIASIGLPVSNFKRYGMQIIVMEYAGNRSLQKLIDDTNEDISFLRRCEILLQISDAINACHKLGIIHLDLKPANIMVMDNDVCKLVDFGSSKRINCMCSVCGGMPICIEDNGQTGGTVLYSAPEVFHQKNVSEKSDIYSFGITMWQLMTRELPYAEFEAHSIIYRVVRGKLRPPLPSLIKYNHDYEYANLMAECWDHDQSKRPNCEELCRRLTNIMALYMSNNNNSDNSDIE